MFNKRAMHLLGGVFTFLILSISLFLLLFSNLTSSSKNIDKNTLTKNNGGQHSYYIKDYDVGANASMAIINDSFGEESLYFWGSLEALLTEETGENIEDFFVFTETFESPSPVNLYVTVPYPIKVSEEEEFAFNDEELVGVEISEYSDRYLVTTKDEQGNNHVYLWGTNLTYFGLGDSEYRPVEIELPKGYNKVKTIGFQATHNIFAILEDENGYESLFVWGDNSSGLFDNFTLEDKMEQPAEIKFDEDEIEYVRISKRNALVTTKDNRNKEHFYIWGDNTHRQVNFDGNEFFYYEPQEMFLSSGGEVKGIALVDSEEIDINEYYFSSWERGLWLVMSAGYPYTSDEDFEKLLSQFFVVPVILIENNGHNYFYAWGEYLMYKDMDVEQLYSSRSSSIEKFEFETFKNQEILDLDTAGGTHLFLTEDSSGDNHIYGTGANGNATIFYDGWESDPQNIYIDFYCGEFVERVLPSKNIRRIEAENWISSAITVDENGNDLLYLWGMNQQYQFGDSMGWKEFTWSDENYTLMDQSILNDCGATESFYNNDSKGMEFSFIIRTDKDFDPSKITAFNQDMEEMEKVTFVEQKSANEYLFRVDSGSRMYIDDLYWSYDDGETLNLITTDNFYLNESVLITTLYTLIGIVTVLLIISILFLIYSIFVFENDSYLSQKWNKITKRK